MCSAEQPALKALCVCVCLSQSACQTMLIPSEAWLTSSHAFFLLPPLLPSPLVCVVPPQPPDMLSHLSVSPSCTSMWASRTGGNSPLTSQDQTAITNSVTHCLEPLATSFPWCFAADQCLIRGPQGGKTRRSSVCVITGSNQE